MDVFILAHGTDSLERQFFQVPVPARVANELFLQGVKKLTLVVDCEPHTARSALEKTVLSGLELTIEQAPAGVALIDHALALARPDASCAIVLDGCLCSKGFYKALLAQAPAAASAHKVVAQGNSELTCAILLGPGGADAVRSNGGADKLSLLVLPGTSVAVSKDSKKEVERFLIDGLRKTIDSDGVIAYYLMRPVTLRATRLLARTPILPNHVTLLSFAIGMTGVGLVAFGDRWLAALGGLLFFVAATTDCIDGEIARLRYKMSYLGGWLDTFTDDIQTSTCILACGYYQSRTGGGEIWLVLGAVAAAAFVLPQLYVYLDIHRRYHSSDTVDFKFAWEKPSPAIAAETRPSLAGVLKYAFKRDFFTFLFALLIALEAQVVLVAVNLAANVTRAVLVGISAAMSERSKECA
ncbi:MAG: CDP-alcohol phosphatidyltransferase family protein [Myxococcales bacterium]|nr:CDP-alcohol phosphatidyltransferase family protein [Myxococcales bacterium]